MVVQSKKFEIGNLPDSELHDPLKNRPGEKGDSDHAQSDSRPSDELAEAVQESEADTAIADELKREARVNEAN